MIVTCQLVVDSYSIGSIVDESEARLAIIQDTVYFSLSPFAIEKC